MYYDVSIFSQIGTWCLVHLLRETGFRAEKKCLKCLIDTNHDRYLPDKPFDFR